MKRRTLLSLTIAGFMAASGLAFADSHAAHPETGEPLASDQTFSYRLLDQFPTLDPQLNEETAGFHVIRQIFEGLLAQDENGVLVPAVATAWEASEGNLVWTFTLREDAVWSNGDPVTAHDFVYAWQRAADPATASPYSWYLELTEIVNASEILAGEKDPSELGVEAVDDFTLKVTLNTPLPYFPAMTTYATLYPAHQATVEAHGDAWTQPENIVSNGAYTLAELNLNESFQLTKSDTYWDADSVIITEVNGYVVNDDGQALTRYLADEFDHLEPLPAGQFPTLQEQYPDEATSVPRLCSYYYTFNLTDTGHPILQDPNARLALSYAIDRDIIVNRILQGGQTEAFSFVHPATADFEVPEIDYAKLSQEERDAKAAELWAAALAAGDYEEPITFELIFNTSESHRQIANAVSQMWRQKLGVETELANFEWQTYLDIRGNQNFDVARSAWCGDYNEASTFLDLLTTQSGYNDGKYSNATVDELMADAKTADNPQANYTQVEQIAAEEMAIAPIYHYANAFMLDSSIKGWPYNNVENNWYVKNFYRVAE